jgi:hypothetical protein
MVTLEESLLASVTNTPEGVGVARVTAKTTDSPGDTVTPEPSMISVPAVTITFATALARFGAPGVAVIITEPGAWHVIGTLTLVEFGAKFTAGGTVATLLLLEFRETERPVTGAGAERFKVRF